MEAVERDNEKRKRNNILTITVLDVREGKENETVEDILKNNLTLDVKLNKV